MTLPRIDGILALMGGGSRMFDEFVPKLKVGAIKPLSVIDFSCYEFYRLAPPGSLLIMVAAELSEFGDGDGERASTPVDLLVDRLVGYVDQLVERGADLVMQSGVPLALLLGVEGHDRMIERMVKRSGKPATSSVLGIVAAAKHLRLRRIAVASNWSDPMLRTLGEFLARGGARIVGAASEIIEPAQFRRMGHARQMELARELGRAALLRYPNADGLYIGGSSWLSEPVCQALEREFGKPTISDASAMVWDALTRLDAWSPIAGQGRLLSSS